MVEIAFGDHQLKLDEARLQFGHLRSEFGARGKPILDRFLRDSGLLREPEALFQIIQQSIENAINEAVELSLTKLAEFKIYDLGEQFVRERLVDHADKHGDLANANEAIWAFLNIGQSAADREAARAESLDGRPGIIGGGFGVEGAAQGMAIAAAANAAIGAAYGIASKTASGIAGLGDRKRRNEWMRDPHTKRAVAECIPRLMLAGSNVVASLINDRAECCVFQHVSVEEASRAAILRSNFKKGRVSDDDIADVLLQAISIDPFAREAWQLWIEQFGDSDLSLENAADSLHFEFLPEIKASALAELRRSLSWSTPEECENSRDLLEARAIYLGVPFDQERDSIQKRIVQLDEERRTVDGVVYADISAAQEVRNRKADEALRTVDGEVFPTVEMAASERRRREDLAERTFNETVYETAGAAQLARDRYKAARNPLLWLTIIFGPLPNALFVVSPGFTVGHRLVAAGATALFVVLALISDDPVFQLTSNLAWGLLLLGVRLALEALLRGVAKVISSPQGSAKQRS